MELVTVCPFFLLLLLTEYVYGGDSFEEDRPNAMKGYKVHRLTPATTTQMNLLVEMSRHVSSKKLEDDIDQIAFWTEPDHVWLGQSISVMVSPQEESRFLQSIVAANITHDVIINDVESAITKQKVKGPEDLKAVALGTMSWTAYHDYHIIERFLEHIAETYPNLVRKEVAGLSYEGRNIYLLKLSTPQKDGKTKPAIWMDAQIHAREWIASATLTYMIKKMLTGYESGDPVAKRMLDEIDWYIIPVLNVDGFVYTHLSSATAHRLNRITRSVNPFHPWHGADPNRNYDHMWMDWRSVASGGATQNPGTQTYAGAYPLSEIEVLLMRETFLKHRDQVKVLLSFHSYSQVWLYPWGYDTIMPVHWQDQHKMGVRATEALRKKYNTEYDVGPAVSTIGNQVYEAAGATDDWGYAKGMVKYSYTVELRDIGQHGFLLPPDQIIPSGEETFDAIDVVAQMVVEEYGYTLD